MFADIKIVGTSSVFCGKRESIIIKTPLKAKVSNIKAQQYPKDKPFRNKIIEDVGYENLV